MKSTFSILFYIDRSKPSGEGLCFVRCRIWCNGRTASFSTRQQTSPHDWLAKKGRVGPTSAVAQGVNHALSDIEQRLNALYERTLREERYITAEYLKEQYLRQDKPRQTFADIYSALCEEKAAHKSKATARGFRDSYKSFVRFLDTRGLRRCLPHEVDKTLIEAYRLYMLRDLGYKMSSVAVYLRRLHQVFRRAMLEAGLREDPFDLIDIETPAYERNALSAEDLQRLLAYRPHRSVDNHVRLIFLLGCFTGLAFSDLKKLRIEDVYTLSDGRRYLSICRTKTQNGSIVPLLPIAEEILAYVVLRGYGFGSFPSTATSIERSASCSSRPVARRISRPVRTPRVTLSQPPSA